MNNDRINEVYFGKLYDVNSEFYKRTRNRITWICRQVHGKNVLDIGCSQGIVCLLLGCEGFHCIGVDNEEEAIKYAKKELAKEEAAVQKRVEFILAEASELPFDDNSFDTIILAQVMEHLVHPEKLLRESKRLLKENGRIIITVPFGLLLYDDHKETYYPSSFIDMISPFFNTSFIDIVDKNIFYIGIKDSKNRESGEKVANIKIGTIKKFEGRFLDVEYELNAKKNQIVVLKDKIKEANKKNEIFRSKMNEIEKTFPESLQKEKEKSLKSYIEKEKQLEKAFGEREKALKDELSKKEKELETLIEKNNMIKGNLETQQQKHFSKIISIENKYENKLYELEYMLKTSASWRLGRLFVSGLVFTKNFMLNPVKFLGDSSYRNKDISSFIYCSQKESLTPKITKKITKKEKVSSINETSSISKVENSQLTFGAIMDEFTTSCFRPECKLITFRPDNWKTELEKNPVDAIFVESAWHGNDGSWQYRIASYQKNMGDELIELVDWAKNKGLPTIFWNKEDPPNYNRFIEKAGIFDFIFTSDSDCIPKYKMDTGNKKVYPLPFAAQPLIHNPIVEHSRKHAVCFAGTYYGNRHEERRKDMEYLLKPALKFGLEIYDRQYGLVGKQAEIFKFPDIYQHAIKGRLNYTEMLDAYKQYKVFLNVNSVKNSPTMFSRRVFELLACGTPVISTYSKGIIDMLGNDIVFITESESDTKNYLEKLLNNEDEWKRASVKGIRKVMEKHTYTERLNFIADQIGLQKPQKRLSSFSILSKCANDKQLKNLINILNRQTYKNFELVLLLEGGMQNNLKTRINNGFKEIRVNIVDADSRDTFNQCQGMHTSEYMAVMYSTDYYGPNYLKDFALAIMYSGYKVLGKHTHFSFNMDKSEYELNNIGYDFKNVDSIPTSTMVFRKKTLNLQSVNELFSKRIFHNSDKILSIDHYNYGQNNKVDVLNTDITKNSIDKIVL